MTLPLAQGRYCSGCRAASGLSPPARRYADDNTGDDIIVSDAVCGKCRSKVCPGNNAAESALSRVQHIGEVKHQDGGM